MDDKHAEVVRLLRLAQTGFPEEALVLAEERLRLADDPGTLYGRAVALHCIGDHDGAARAAERILALTADGDLTGPAADGSMATEFTGWRSIALPFRAWQHLLLSETNRQAFELESILHDLAQAEAMLSKDVYDGFTLATAHTCLGNGYHELRLYELARPNYEAAFAAATAQPEKIFVDHAVESQLNLATMHLNR